MQGTAGVKALMNHGEKLVFDVDVKEAGNYNLTMTGLQVESWGCIVDVYICLLYTSRCV